MLVFSTGFLNYCPFSMVSSPPSPTFVNKYTVKTYTVCKGGEYGVIGGKGASERSNTCRKVPLQVNLLYNDIWHCFLSV